MNWTTTEEEYTCPMDIEKEVIKYLFGTYWLE